MIFTTTITAKVIISGKILTFRKVDKRVGNPESQAPASCLVARNRHSIITAAIPVTVVKLITAVVVTVVVTVVIVVTVIVVIVVIIFYELCKGLHKKGILSIVTLEELCDSVEIPLI